LAPERRPGYPPGYLPGHQCACPESDRPPVAFLQVWFDPLALLPARLPPAGGGVDGAGGVAAGLRRLAMRGRSDWRHPERPRRLRSGFRSLHSPWERLEDRRKNAASGVSSNGDMVSCDATTTSGVSRCQPCKIKVGTGDARPNP
jgi:hypothetical protein